MAPKIKFEAALKKLEKIVEQFEKDELSLEELTGKYEEGMKLINFCGEELSKAENKIEMFVGKKKVPFEECKKNDSPQVDTSIRKKSK
ncbi:MAG: exodeoxyribonuclease VII small subunit [Candidatus Aureabacteria bacterium]|nr:exodeoxyribonuclease VII small subunit [Candidatus Auribacterota bacterium]MCK5162047.1 exodeoxyribonuclease VII small subunit [Candidatus Auribacterota bacterium]MCK5654655.1 exodeoxyribonuclease VII small subunit [Candidatus Auribacterota bacterium]